MTEPLLTVSYLSKEFPIKKTFFWGTLPNWWLWIMFLSNFFQGKLWVGRGIGLRQKHPGKAYLLFGKADPR